MSRVHHFDSQAKKKSMQWKHPSSPPPKNIKSVSSVSSVRKVMASFFWDSQAVIMLDYLEESHKLNSAYHAEDLRRLRQEIAKKRRVKFTRGVLLLQDNATVHTSQVAMATVTRCSFVLPYPPYSPD